MTSIRDLAGYAAALLALVATAATAAAQSPPTRLRGSIAAIDGKTATIATREGSNVKVNLADNWAVMLVSPVSIALTWPEPVSCASFPVPPVIV